jgi:Trypsin-co-occurring domain 1
MGKILKLKAGKSIILVESSDVSERGGRIREAGGIETVKKNLDKLLETINPISQSIVETFQKLPSRPDSATAAFGLKFSVEGSLIFAKASGEASLTVSLTWNTDREESN